MSEDSSTISEIVEIFEKMVQRHGTLRLTFADLDEGDTFILVYPCESRKSLHNTRPLLLKAARATDIVNSATTVMTTVTHNCVRLSDGSHLAVAHDAAVIKILMA